MKTNSTADAYAHGRFLVYLDLILDPGIGTARKNFCLHEIWKDGLWKSDFRSIGEFAKATHMHTSQLFKRIGSAQVYLQMVDAGMVSNRPIGREVELLLRVPPGHRVDAWRAVVEKVKERGNSNAVVRETLSEYANRLQTPTA